jgi:hypothetical protein
MRSANHDDPSHPNEHLSKHQRRAFISVILGAISICPSLMLISSASGNAGDFQGGGMIFLVAIFGVALLGLPAVIIGITGLIGFLTEKPADRNLIILSVIGILLGSPILIGMVLIIS